MAEPNVPRSQSDEGAPDHRQEGHDHAHRPWTAGRIVRNVAGVLLVLLGIVGLVLPFLQGILFLVIGLAMIDLPIKHRLHVRLMKWGWYRKLAAHHERWLKKWRERRARKRAERERRKALAARSVSPPS